MTYEDIIQILDDTMQAGEVSRRSQSGWQAFSFPWSDVVLSEREASHFFASHYEAEGIPTYNWIDLSELAESAQAFRQAYREWIEESCMAGVFFGKGA